MKSFADWTDEIRELMNPPAPMYDTCNVSWDLPSAAIAEYRWGKSALYDKVQAWMMGQDFKKLQEHLLTYGQAYWETIGLTGKGEALTMVIHDEVQQYLPEDFYTRMTGMGADGL